MTTKEKKAEVMAIDKKISPVEARANAIEVKDEKSEKEANELLSQANRFGDWLADDKATIYDPAWAAVVAIREKYKPRESALKGIIDTLRSKLSKYRTAEKARVDAAAAKIAERVEKGTLKLETGVRKMDEIDRPTESVATVSGVTKYRTIKNFRVINHSKIPHDYMIVDSGKVREAMKKGVLISGIEYFDEEIPMNFRGN